MVSFALPQKTPGFLRRLSAEYASDGKALLAEILNTCKVYVKSGTEHDNWNGGIYGHDVMLFLPLNILQKIKII